MVGWAGADATHRREMIVAAAMDLLHRRGPREVTVRRVARKLGVAAMTLYTYFPSHEALRREMTRRGFAMLHDYCRRHNTLGTPRGWRGGACAYVRFAVENPNLYDLMFSLPYTASTDEDLVILEGGFSQLRDRVRARFAQRGATGRDLESRSRMAAGRYWVALHGLASLAVAGRLSVLGHKLEAVMDDLLPRVQPDDGRDPQPEPTMAVAP